MPENICYSAALLYITLHNRANAIIFVILFAVSTFELYTQLWRVVLNLTVVSNIIMCSEKLLLLLIQGEVS
jgi:hypothetical protein